MNLQVKEDSWWSTSWREVKDGDPPADVEFWSWEISVPGPLRTLNTTTAYLALRQI